MAWIESHQALEKHPKTYDLMSLTGWDLDTAIGKLHRFWWWCVDYAEDGDLRKHNDARLGAAVGLNGEQANSFVKAMVEACWLDRKPYFRVHDWWDYIGKFLQIKYKHNPEKWQRIRELYAKKGTGSETPSKTGSKNGSKTHNQPTDLTNLNQPTDQDAAREFFDLWNSYAGKSNLVTARELTPERRAKIKTRLEERGPEEWGKVFDLCARTPFCNGLERGTWRASLDWVIQGPQNALKVLEGKYGEPQAGYCQAVKESPKDRKAQIMEELD